MRLTKYDTVVSADYTIYEFTSVGKNGAVPKVVVYTPLFLDDVYNLGFGDVDATTGDWTDTITTDNGDYRIVLATVASTVISFLVTHPGASVYATGNTDNRNELYRRGIEHVLREIEPDYDIQGQTHEDEWETFERNRSYEAFLIKRR